MSGTRRRLIGFVAVGLAAVFLSAAPARAGRSADVSAEPSSTALPAGGRGTVAVVIDVHPGLHAQSHHPGNDDYIPLEITVQPPAGVTAGEVRYPPGKDETYPLLGKLNVYVDRVIAYVPLAVAADAKPGPAKVIGKVTLQACNNTSCFQPESLPFDVTVDVVPAGTAVRPNHPELFTGPEAAAAASQPTTAPTTAPAAASQPPKASASVGSGDDWFTRHLKSGGLPFALVGAFLIGILFNAVPCVLPVIPLKVIGFYEVSKHDRGRCLFLGAVFGLGIVAVFAVLGLLIAVLHVIDWDHLFQQTWFLAVITAILVGMAAGTFGLFDFALPSGVYAFSPRHDNVSGNFLFGILTAVLSTPCTFGLLAALLTFTLTLSAAGAIAVFVTIGVGMASPYVALSAFPQVARRFPRTGPWSNVIKQEMGLLMLAAAVFFAQALLAHLMPIEATWWLLFATVAAAAGFLTVRAVQLSGVRWPAVVAVAFSAGMVAVALVATLRLTRWPYEWQPYSPQALADATAAGHPVVIDFTATWCTTCHVVEANALHDRRVVSAVREHRAVMLKADVTSSAAAGQPLLHQLNPIGSIPLTAVYPPHAAADAAPVTLDGIYSADDLVGAIDRVTGGKS